MYIYIYIYIHISLSLYIYIYIYIYTRLLELLARGRPGTRWSDDSDTTTTTTTTAADNNNNNNNNSNHNNNNRRHVTDEKDPMKSETPTPTRAPDNQFRKMQCLLNSIRNNDLLNVWGWGRGFLFHRWENPRLRVRVSNDAFGAQDSQLPWHS